MILPSVVHGQVQTASYGRMIATEDVVVKWHRRRSLLDYDTPIEDCRANEPMCCACHSIQMINKMLVDEFKKRGIPGTVEVRGGKGKFIVLVAVPAKEEHSAIDAVDNLLVNNKSVKKTSSVTSQKENGGQESRLTVCGEVVLASDWQRTELGEWTDNIIAKLAADPDSKRQVSRSDFIAMIGKVGTMHKAFDAANTTPWGEDARAAADAAYMDARSAILKIAAMMDYKDVKTLNAARDVSEACYNAVADARATYEVALEKLKTKKADVFGGKRNALKRYWQHGQPISWMNQGVVSLDFSTTGRQFIEAVDGMRKTQGELLGAGFSVDSPLKYEGRKSLRWALRNLEIVTERAVEYLMRKVRMTNDMIARLDEGNAQQCGAC